MTRIEGGKKVPKQENREMHVLKSSLEGGFSGKNVAFSNQNFETPFFQIFLVTENFDLFLDPDQILIQQSLDPNLDSFKFF
jgi:hypothetical protein